MKSILTIIGLLSISFTASAHDWYQTEKPLAIGERDGVCDVVAQLDLGRGSQPLIVSRAERICQDIYKKEIQNGNPVKALMNGDTQIVNCFVCASTK